MRSHDAERAGLAGIEYLVLCALLREGICHAASFKAENSFVGTSHWLLTWTALRHDGDPALFPGGGEDRYRRGGSSEGKSHASGRRVQGGVSRPGLSTLACPSCSCGTAVSVRPAVSGWAGEGAGLFAVVRGSSCRSGVAQ